MQPGEGTEDTKRRVSYRELLPDDPERAAAVRKLVHILADRDARLITTEGTDATDGAVEVAHEALIRGWSQLREWIDADRAGLRIHRQLTEAAREWEANGRDSSFLHSGTRLAVAQEWAKTRRNELNSLEAEFLAAASRRKRRRVTAALVTSILVMISAVGGGAWFWQRQAQNRRHLSTAVEEALKDANRLADAARAASDRTRWAEAIKTAEGAQQRLRESGVRDETLRHRVADALEAFQKKAKELETQERDRRLVAALGEARLRGTAEAREGGYDLEAIIAAYQQAFREYGIDIGTLPPARAAELIRARPREIREEVAKALDDWAWRAGPPKDSDLLAIASEADPDRQRKAIRDVRAKGDEQALRQLARDLDMAVLPAATLQNLGSTLLQMGEFSDGLKLLQQAQRRHPGDFWINHELALALAKAEPPQYDEAIRYSTVAVALRPDSPGAHNELGIALADKGEYDAAIAACREAIRLKPDVAIYHDNLGVTFGARARPWGARASTTRRSRPAARPSGWSPTWPCTTTTSAAPWRARVSTTRRSRPAARPSG